MKKAKVFEFIFLFIFIWIFLYFQNNLITITNINVKLDNLPDAFDGYKIVHLSDLHCKEFGKGQKIIVNKVKNIQPDLIVFTGDLIDSRHYNIKTSLQLMDNIVKIAPTYFVTGNHEWWSGEFDVLEKALEAQGIYVLRNTYDRIGNNKDEIYIIGIDDPEAVQRIGDQTGVVERQIKQAVKGIEKFNAPKILLIHRPEMFWLYNEYGFDLVLAGHAHGGQIRLPFIGGLIAPDQGFLPEYTWGEYKEANCTMIVSSGLGNSIIPQRLFNYPEIVVLTLLKSRE